MRSLVHVPFSGARSGEGPLTWGQTSMCLAMVRHRRWWNLGSVLDLSDLRPDLPSFSWALGQLLARHESLRTVIRVVDGVSRQVLIQSGVLPVPVVAGADRSGTDRDAADAVDAARAAQLLAGHRQRPFDGDGELPTRVGLVVADGLVRRATMVYDHRVLDGASEQILHEDLRSLLTTRTFAHEPGSQPLEIAHYERGVGEATSDRAIRYWLEQLGRIPPTMLRPVGPPSRPVTHDAILTSTALPPAVRRLAARHGTTPTTVLLAATAAVLAALTGNSVAALNVHVGNRFRPKYRYATGNFVQLSLFVLDVPAGAGFNEILPDAVRSALLAYRYAYYDPFVLERDRKRVNDERRAEVNPLACVNVPDNAFGDASEPECLNDADILARRGSTRLRWNLDTRPSRCHFCLRISDRAGQPRPMMLSADTRYLPPEKIEQFLYDLEESLVLASCERAAGGRVSGRQ